MSTVFEPDKSGINSLGGFSYQIRVFAYYLSKLEKGMQLEFESYDDVSLTKINPKVLESNEENFRSIISGSNTTSAIQVKRTTISKDTAQHILLNWIILEKSDVEIGKYILLTEKSYGNDDNIFNLSCKDLFLLVRKTTKSRKATIRKVKDIFKENYEEFERVYESIKSKYSFEEKKDIDDEIAEVYLTLFKRYGVNNEVIYFQRIKALLEKVTNEIMECINKKKSYIMTYNTFMQLAERISIEISDDNPIIDYISFKRSCSIDVNDESITELRQFKQLSLCELPSNLIQQHLVYCFYYDHFRFTYSEMNKINKIENVEEIAFENFTEIKFMLESNNRDTPRNRLEETKNKGNSYADNDQIKYGVIIHLTKNDTGEKQISWKEEE